ncbi:protoporphyrinogen oxidase [Kitasatospora sp. KL5]|uniref:protoporphyrinogen oxidase n=1 Tax=Kitasatospora sp. KL5 TaxID=3425125 RepID=UPI003D6F03AA
MNTTSTRRSGHVVVIGGGIAGLTAALRLTGAGLRVTVLEADGRVGGKLRAGEIAGAPTDLGAEALFARQPEAVQLARAVGLADRLQPAATTATSLWSRGELRQMPAGHLMGVPGDLEALAASGVLSAAGLARTAEDLVLPPTAVGDDIAIGSYVAQRFGREVVDRLVEPLLGLYAGGADRVSTGAVLPQLLEAARKHASLLEAVGELRRAAAARTSRSAGPLFMGVDGGVGLLADAVACKVRAAGGSFLVNRPARGLARSAAGWEVRTDDRVLAADAVVLATPARAAATLLAPHAPGAAAELSQVEYASIALVTTAFSRADLTALPAGSGFLVPPVDGRTITTATFSGNKWRWISDAAPDLFVLRTSIGDGQLHRDDADLVTASLRDLSDATGLTAKPVAGEVTRWTDGLPQYTVGHPARIERIRRSIADLPGIAVCGAVYDGIGIPSCIAGAQRAAEEILAALTVPAG